MKILIFLFAIITFILMASDPRREDFETRETHAKNQDTQNQNMQENDSEESS